MPYDPKHPPKKTHTLDPKGRRQWVHVLNSALAKGDSEGAAHKKAWSTVARSGHRKSEKSAGYPTSAVDPIDGSSLGGGADDVAWSQAADMARNTVRPTSPVRAPMTATNSGMLRNMIRRIPSSFARPIGKPPMAAPTSPKTPLPPAMKDFFRRLQGPIGPFHGLPSSPPPPTPAPAMKIAAIIEAVKVAAVTVVRRERMPLAYRLGFEMQKEAGFWADAGKKVKGLFTRAEPHPHAQVHPPAPLGPEDMAPHGLMSLPPKPITARPLNVPETPAAPKTPAAGRGGVGLGAAAGTAATTGTLAYGAGSMNNTTPDPSGGDAPATAGTPDQAGAWNMPSGEDLKGLLQKYWPLLFVGGGGLSLLSNMLSNDEDQSLMDYLPGLLAAGVGGYKLYNPDWGSDWNWGSGAAAAPPTPDASAATA